MIPRIIHRIWIGGDEPDWLQALSYTWSRPGWEIWQWTDANVPTLFPLRNQEIWDRAHEIAPDHVGQLRSDVLRYELLERFGGIYVDADFECLRPIDPLIEGLECFTAWEVQGRWINNAIIGAAPGHRFIRALIDGIPESVRRRRGLKPNQITGPGYVTPTWRRHGRGVKVFPQRFFYPYSFDEIAEHEPGADHEGAYAVHHWHNKRREQGVPVGREIP